jgi:hypothetical protein
MNLRAYIVALHAALFAILLAVSPAGSGSMMLLGAGKQTAAAAGYTGPLDVIGTNVIACYSLMACSAALRGVPAVNVCNSTGGVDVGCGDLSTDATTGALVPATISGITCPGANCTIKTWYDQTTGNHCNSADCNLKTGAGGVASRPTLIASGFGSNGAASLTSTQELDTSTTNLTLAQPYTMASVSCQIANVGGLDLFFGNGSANGALYWNGTPAFSMFAGSGGVVGASNRNTWQFYAGAFNNAGGSGSSGMVSGGSLVTGVGAGSGGFSANVIQLNTGFPANFRTVENIIWSTDKSANFSALQANQATRWGTGSC